MCNSAANTYVTPYPPTKVIEVPAGASIITEWYHTLSGRVASDSDDPISASHKGPIMAYMARVDDATTTDTSDLECAFAPNYSPFCKHNLAC